MKRWGFAVVAAAGFALAGCAGQAAPAPTSSAVNATVAVTSAAWSQEAVTACRTFTNSIPNMTLVESQIAKYKPTMTAEELSVAKTGWGLATASVSLPSSLGIDAEPEVHDALSAVAVALDTSITDPNYVKINAEAFGDAVAVCEEVGV